MTARSVYASQAIVSADLSTGAALVLEHFGPEGAISINAYDKEGGLLGYAHSVTKRDQMLALGRAIVEALDPVPDPPVTAPLTDWELRLLDTPWEGPTLIDEPESAREYHRRLVGEAIGAASMCWAGTPQGVFLDRRASSIVDEILGTWDGDSVPDDACTCPPGELEYVDFDGADSRLPLDVEIRTIALDAAVQWVGGTDDDVVTHAREIERFLVGDAEGVAAPRWIIGQTLTVEDLDALPVGAWVIDRDGDKSERRRDNEDTHPWLRNGSFNYSSDRIGAYAPVTLVSLP